MYKESGGTKWFLDAAVWTRNPRLSKLEGPLWENCAVGLLKVLDIHFAITIVFIDFMRKKINYWIDI